MSLDDALHHCQTDPGAARLAGVEEPEDARQLIGSDARAVVADRPFEAGRRPRAVRSLVRRAGWRGGNVARANVEMAALSHCLERVGHQCQTDLLDLRGVELVRG